MVHFTADRIKVQETMKHLKQAFGKDHTRASVSFCELTVISTKATFAVPGAIFSVDCIATGAAKATFSFIRFFKLVELEYKDKIEMTLTPSSVAIGNFTFHAETWFFPNDRILRTIRLPMNYTLIDLVNLKDGTYTQEELDFNKVHEKIAAAEASLDKAINSCYKQLKNYGIRLPEIDLFVKSMIYK